VVRRFAGTAVVLGVLGLAAAALLLWQLPANDFLFVPDRAKPLADKVVVQGAQAPAKGDVYYVDLFVRRIRKLEQLLPFTRPDGATFVPEERLVPDGTSDEDRDRQNAEDMQRSEKIAAVVALRALGYDVKATPSGVLVTTVYTNVPAAKVLETNDVIVGVNGVAVRTPAQLRREIGLVTPGSDVRLTIRRGGKVRDVTVRTVANPEDASRAVVGILVDQDAKIELPIDVDIDLGRVGGPSAGLPFALEIARKLGRDITHGCRIAATGALALDGTVIPIGGVKQKTIGARRADVDFFLVPAGENAKDARDNASGLPIIPVESFQQALRKLATDRVKC
jgi:PDZ domain-containing protein